MGFSPAETAQIIAAIAEAKEAMRKCKAPACLPGYEEYSFTDEDRYYVIGMLDVMTVHRSINIPMVNGRPALGYAPQHQSSDIELHPSALKDGCLASVLAHEASHLGRNWGREYRGTEERSAYIQKVCFGCGYLK